MPTIDDWNQFLMTAKVVDDEGRKATGKKVIGTKLIDQKPGKVADSYYPIRPIWGERAKPQVNWSITDRAPRTCSACLDQIREGSQAVYSYRTGNPAHPRCVDDWSQYARQVRGGATEAEKRSALGLTYHKKVT